MFNDPTTPMQVELNVLKTIRIVPIFPLINELNRTTGVALAGEDFDFSYVKNRITKNVDQIRENAEEYVEK